MTELAPASTKATAHFHWRLIVTGLGVGAAIIGSAAIFSQILPPAYDFHGVYYPAAQDLAAGRFSYATSPGYLNPPWALIMLAPLSWLEVDFARGLLLAVTLVVMFRAMRDYARFKFSFPLAAISLPLLAVVWLGQIEVFALAGAVVAYRAVQQRRAWWLASGLLLMLVKPQETWIIMVWVLLVSRRHWSKTDWLQIILPVVIVAGVTSWWMGADWLTRLLSAPTAYAQQWQNFALYQVAANLPHGTNVALWLGVAASTTWGIRRTGVDRGGLGLAAVSSNLLSPYLTNPQVLVTMCLGWGALLDRSGRWGALAYLASLTPLLRFTSADQAWNQLDLLFPVIVWLGLIWRLVRQPQAKQASHVSRSAT
jgi:hypothetical protein